MKMIFERCVFLDFEYFNSNERVMSVVSASMQTRDKKSLKEYWFNKSSSKLNFLKDLKYYIDNRYVLVAYAVTAEARSILSLIEDTEFKGIDTSNIKWIDLYLEYRMICNHHPVYSRGEHLVDGRVVNIVPKYMRTPEDKGYMQQFGLVSACFKLLGVRIDANHKDAMRDIVLSKDWTLIEKHKQDIIDYNTSDIKYLKLLTDKITNIYELEMDKTHYNATLTTHMHNRGNYAYRTAIMERDGYPINYEAAKTFSDSVPEILISLQREINSLFPEITPFRYDAKKGKYTWNQKVTKQWIEESVHAAKWLRTTTGSYSLSLDAWGKFFHARHDYPKDCFGSQMKRYLSTKQSMNGFMPAPKGRSNFWDSVGSDSRVRPFFGIYGSQSSRSQPKMTSYLHLKSAWMRVLCEPAAGVAITSCDYSSEEFLLGGVMASSDFSQAPEGDQAMIEAYYSGDPYSWFAKAAGAMPEDGTKKSHPKIRDAFKSTVLALQYMMGDEALAKKLTADTKESWSVKQAKTQRLLFERTFPFFTRYRQLFIDHSRHNYSMSKDGWVLWNGNTNPRSCANWPMQTGGAVIMRKAVQLAQDNGLKVILTLHDALYIEHAADDWEAMITLRDCMQKAFQWTVGNAYKIRLDFDTWSPDYLGDSVKKVKKKYELLNLYPSVKDKYIDPRGEKEYEKFKQYLDPENLDEL